MEQITYVLNTVSSWAVAIAAILGLLATIFKPIRKLIAYIFNKVRGDSVVDKLTKTISELQAELSKQIEAVSNKCDNNEKDRLKQIIFQYGNYARKHEHISSEEFRYLQMVFTKYTSLGGNDIAHDEYNFIVDYYNKQNIV